MPPNEKRSSEVRRAMDSRPEAGDDEDGRIYELSVTRVEGLAGTSSPGRHDPNGPWAQPPSRSLNLPGTLAPEVSIGSAIDSIAGRWEHLFNVFWTVRVVNFTYGQMITIKDMGEEKGINSYRGTESVAASNGWIMRLGREGETLESTKRRGKVKVKIKET